MYNINQHFLHAYAVLSTLKEYITRVYALILITAPQGDISPTSLMGELGRRDMKPFVQGYAAS